MILFSYETEKLWRTRSLFDLANVIFQKWVLKHSELYGVVLNKDSATVRIGRNVDRYPKAARRQYQILKCYTWLLYYL